MSGSARHPAIPSENLRRLERLRSPEPKCVEEAWAEFLHGYAPLILQVVSVCERDAENRQECFVYACEHLCRNRFHRLRQFQPDGPATFATWLRAVVRNLCIDWQRRQLGQRVLLRTAEPFSASAGEPPARGGGVDDLTDPFPDPEMLAVEWQQILALGSALSCLTPQQRLAVRLRFQQELTLLEIARVMNLKNSQAADRLLRDTLLQLRRIMNNRHNFLGKSKPASV